MGCSFVHGGSVSSLDVHGRCADLDGHGTHPATVTYGRTIRFENVTYERYHGTGQEASTIAA